MIHKINIYLLSLILALFPAFVYAAVDVPPRPSWLPEGDYQIRSVQIRSDALSADIAATRDYVMTQNGSRFAANAQATVNVTSSDVGSVMSKRISAVARGGGVALAGVIAVEGLLEGIGWVMENGTYVKHKPADTTQNPTNIPQAWADYSTNPKTFWGSPEAICEHLTGYYSSELVNIKDVSNGGKQCVFASGNKQTVYLENNPYYNPNAPAPQDQIIPITPDLIGKAIFHNGYQDPVDSSKNATVNTGNADTDTITAASTPQDGETDNDIVNKTNAALDAAPKTQTSDGTQGTSNNSTSDANGNPLTNSTGSFNLPAFCNWAAVVCDHIKWVEKDEIPAKDPIDPPDSTTPDTKTVDINFGAQCPDSVTIPFDIEGQSSDIKVVDYQPICAQAPIIRPATITFATIMAAMIVFGRRET